MSQNIARQTFHIAGFFGVALVLGACATAPTAAPTHYWTSEGAQSETKYNHDNAQCEDAANLTDEAALLSSSGSFQAYQECMIGRGYVLRTY